VIFPKYPGEYVVTGVGPVPDEGVEPVVTEDEVGTGVTTLIGTNVAFCWRYALLAGFDEIFWKYRRVDPASTLITVRVVRPVPGPGELVVSWTCHVTADAAITSIPIIRRTITAAVRVLLLWAAILFRETYQDNVIYSFR
jgi:hypothetical protein